jgi:hypothetical protein
VTAFVPPVVRVVGRQAAGYGVALERLTASPSSLGLPLPRVTNRKVPIRPSLWKVACALRSAVSSVFPASHDHLVQLIVVDRLLQNDACASPPRVQRVGMTQCCHARCTKGSPPGAVIPAEGARPEPRAAER